MMKLPKRFIAYLSLLAASGSIGLYAGNVDVAQHAAETLDFGSDGLEGESLTPYRDVAGVLTVCSGVTGSDIIPDKLYTQAECDELDHRAMSRIVDQINPHITANIPFTTRTALYSFAYNIGATHFETSTLIYLLNAGKTHEACDQMKLWRMAGGKVVPGLVNRRAIEKGVCDAQRFDELLHGKS